MLDSDSKFTNKVYDKIYSVPHFLKKYSFQNLKLIKIKFIYYKSNLIKNSSKKKKRWFSDVFLALQYKNLVTLAISDFMFLFISRLESIDITRLVNVLWLVCRQVVLICEHW